VLAEIITVERRRRWNDADKARIVAETFDPETSISEVARRHGLHASQLFAWRRLARDGGLRIETAGSAVFAPVFVSAEPVAIEAGTSAPAIRAEESMTCDAAKTGRMEIVIGRGRRIIVFADVDTEALSRVLRVIERR
jgi:transposase